MYIQRKLGWSASTPKGKKNKRGEIVRIFPTTSRQDPVGDGGPRSYASFFHHMAYLDVHSRAVLS
jgi:hypothetical protein